MKDNKTHELKFLNKNKNNFEKLNQFININRNNIRLILASPEMCEYLKSSNDCENIIHKGYPEFTHIKYKGIFVIEIPLKFPINVINFILKNNDIKFNIPCICGIYKDEKHS